MTPEELHRIFAEFTSEHCGTSKHQDFFRAMHRQALKGMGLVFDARIQESGERGVMGFVAAELRRRGVADAVVFDVGANVGHYSDAVIRAIDAATVWSFEPSQAAFRIMVDEVASRHPDRCRAFNIGFSDCPGEATLQADRQGSGLASLYQREAFARFPQESLAREQVRLETIDGFCNDNGIAHIHFLKIDVEGHEIAVLKGAQAMLDRKAIDFIQFEFGGCNIDSRTFLRDFWQRLDGFAICRVMKDGLYRLTTYDEFDEIFAYQNFLAIRQA